MLATVADMSCVVTPILELLSSFSITIYMQLTNYLSDALKICLGMQIP